MSELARPDGLGDKEWAAIDEAVGRLDRAHATRDHALVIGSAKELCESVARVVINERGGVAPGDDMTDLVHTAHKVLEFQPGEGIASDAETRKLAQSMKTMVFALAELRNRHGTGHGRATPSGVTAEHADIAYGAAALWTRWALRRLEPYIAGNVTALVRDLDEEIFTKGDLARRLKAANLSRLEPNEQRRLGTAVGRRSARGTFVVATDGVDQVSPDDSATWPQAYVEGVIAGLFFDANGYVDLGEWPVWSVRQVARLVSGHPDGVAVLRDIVVRLSRAADAGRIRSDEKGRASAAAEARAVADSLGPGEFQQLWQRVAEKLSPPALVG